MLSKTLQNIETYLNSKMNLKPNKTTKFLSKLEYFEKDSYLNPYDFKQYADLTEKDTYSIFSHLCYLGIVNPAYKLYCPKCNKVSEIFDSLESLDDHDYCENELCSYHFNDNKHKYIVLMYKVIHE